jgi:hypothetical protein
MADDEDTKQGVEIKDPQVWELEIDGRLHRVETSTPGWINKVVWSVDGERVAEKASSVDDNLHLGLGKDEDGADELGALKVRFTGTGRPRRVTHFDGDRTTAMTKATIGTGGTDLDPEPGSKAARREEWAEGHPVLASLDEILGGVGKVVIPLVAAALIPIILRLLPDWDIDLPFDLPSIPWPDIDLPIPHVDITLPGWVGTLLEVLKYTWPILLGCAIAWSEYQRRKRNAAARAERQALRDSAARDIPSSEPDEAGDEQGEPDDGEEHDGQDDDVLRGDRTDRREG